MRASTQTRGRRSHQKSRHGCQQCKLRKVKCGEEKPSCINCRRHGVTCSFAQSPSCHDRSPSCNQVPTPQDNTRTIVSGSPGSDGQSQAAVAPDLAIADLELLHHFTTSTAYTFSHHPVLQSFWRVEVPQIGFTAPYTLQAILALSALHLATLRPERSQSYIAQANIHHEAALKLATPEMANITPENSAPLFLFSALSTFIWCAKPLKLGNFLFWENHEIASWLVLIRGTGTILDFADEALKNGPLASMFSARARNRISEPVPQHQVLENLRNLVMADVQEEHTANICNIVIDEMNRPFILCLERNLRLETADVFIWLLRVPHEFLLLLKDYQPLAMVIVGYFCVVLHQLEWMWCMRGWSTHLLSQIYNQLSPAYRAWIRWPIEQIGFLPPR
ncbi:hypothetical protein BO94DRAFT_555577 [Aspergillus sclerotioniger CBS 115572]|uniref:Zn(2)-C6 fungal-type domain-containing protein n=1 Tax=Aspergillus sclerotioniger CBS 115572 TaxID=1450535 RepID=A0A317WVM4_9EURO|nr:hypothetical protein BO94DRAFT_555577 [Aspergillus sclerotioniger CBS 115572]PWY90416.1 hypothetical protein BO94DRAFT_555577 [Aspergillus sclerotioniger CBS 115572]